MRAYIHGQILVCVLHNNMTKYNYQFDKKWWVNKINHDLCGW